MGVVFLYDSNTLGKGGDMLKLGTVTLYTTSLRMTATCMVSLLILCLLGSVTTGFAASHDGSSEASTSEASQRDAIRSIPFEEFSPSDRAKVKSVLANVSIFRRMPVKTIDCNPDLYIFLVRHPDVVVNIWEIMKVSRIEIRQTAPKQFQIAEAAGTVGNMEYLYSDASTHVIYAEGVYQGPLFARPVKGRTLLLLKTGVVHEPDGRYRVTSQLDSFVCIEHGGVELLTKTIQPILGKTADHNFVQTLNFVSSLSRSIEINSRSVQRLAARLDHVPTKVRTQFAELAGTLGKKAVDETADDRFYTEEAVSYQEPLPNEPPE
jgi:hypothetical protein